MSVVFYLIGLFLIAGGVAWSVLAVLALGVTRPGTDISDILAAVFSASGAAPGLAVAVSGLLFLAIGRVLGLLARIARNTHTAHLH